MTKRTSTIAAALFCLGAGTLFAVPADLTYVEGDTVMKLKSGKQQDAQIGDTMNTGDTLRTGADGQAEISQSGVTIKVAAGTVFTLMERATAGKTTGVLSVALGSVKYRYDKLTGSEPQVRTNGAVAGVRGTEFTVFSGADGSTLITVDSGAVTVESEGQSVDLAPNEGVEVPLGRPPGQKLDVQRLKVDYDTWNADKLSGMLADPMAALAGIQTVMDGYAADVTKYAADFKDASTLLATERANRVKVTDDQGADAGQKYETDVVTPILQQAVALGLDLRYSTLAALSLRRFVAGRLFVLMKARSLAEPSADAWTSFLARYQQILVDFETSIAPHLVEADI
jgi:hypothetical protein